MTGALVADAVGPFGVTRDTSPDSISWFIGIFREVRPAGWRIHADKTGYEDRQEQGARNRLHDGQGPRDLGQGGDVANSDSGERAKAEIKSIKATHPSCGTVRQRKVESIGRDLRGQNIGLRPE